MSNIAAVIVTYNRLGFLKECLAAVQYQTLPVNEIIVVNNGSTDGTGEWLDLQSNLTVIHQENLGGGGGFYTGTKTAHEKGYDWIWLMDDDGYPAPDCLARLIAASKKHNDIAAWGCLVLNRDDNRQLAFECPAVLTATGEINTAIEIIANWAAFFNGTLLSRQIVSKIGYPNPALFIWGDEVDYYQRILKAGGKIASTGKAIFYHPQDRLYAIKHKGQYVYDGPINWRAYCFFRNRAYLGRKYFNSTHSTVLLNQFSYFRKKLPLGQFFKAVALVLKAHADGLSFNLKRKLPY